MKHSNRSKKILKTLEVTDHKAWGVAHHEAFEFFKVLLKEEEDKISKEIYSEVSYTSPNWQLKRADQAGQLRIIKQLQSLIED